MSVKISPEQRAKFREANICTACGRRKVSGFLQCAHCRELSNKRHSRNRIPRHYPQHMRAAWGAKQVINAAREFVKALRENRGNKDLAQDLIDSVRFYEGEFNEAGRVWGNQ